ncbi:class I SAM-dependent methyltransferase [Loktanella sp. Alg231-35]|uniref:class I SAM-dependent methyltransferase n=1 Tax=Loktanella sp. Alg231-35 TaxID=1922220 RepID=UPI000D55865A|nr:class I SAM-dependent methyltransferase [Loktanella sp. Alg231-35]
MNDVRDQYEAFPYPARDPKDEAKRLIKGSPSLPVEMDHCLWNGQRDWSQTLRVLVAGGGTGDGLVQLAQLLHAAGKPYQITYLDLSSASRKIAEARIKMRGLPNVQFETGSLLNAAAFGPFDYIDCCGVLHHLPDPEAGLAALHNALTPGGGLGFMVYAPYGRSGVYPLQAAFNRLYGHLPPKSQLKHAKATFAKLPAAHPLNRNPNLGDHKQSEAGFYDLLVHSQDRAFTVRAWADALTATGWKLASFAQPGRYDLAQFADVPADMDALTQMATAEKLRGTIKTHVGYARRKGDPPPAELNMMARIPHLNGADVQKMAQAVAAKNLPKLRVGAEEIDVTIPPKAAGLLAAVDGKTTVNDVIAAAKQTPQEGLRLWQKLEAALMPWGLLHYSGFLR